MAQPGLLQILPSEKSRLDFYHDLITAVSVGGGGDAGNGP